MSATVLHGDCIAEMRAMDDACVDAIVTDPPAGIAFMGKAWDGDKGGRDQWITWMQGVADEAMRVAKPGAHALVWALPRTSHWTATAWENAGWEVRERLSHLFGSGFPKSLNVSKALTEKGACSCQRRGAPCPDAHTLQDVQRPTAEASAGTSGSILLPPLRMGREAQTSDPQGVRHLRQGMDAEGSVPSCAQSDVLTGMQQQADLGAEGGEANREDGGAAGDAVCALRYHRSGASKACGKDAENLLQPILSSEGACGSPDPSFRKHEGTPENGCEVRDGQSSLERRGDVSEQARELRVGSLCEVSAGTAEHGAEGRLHHGAPASDGAVGRSSIVADGVRASRRSQSAEQRSVKSGTLAGQPKPQDGRAWPVCGGCGKPIVPDGLGTALKPAMEDWWLLRKPLSEKTVAQNVLTHGCGALNIDGSRIPSSDSTARHTNHTMRGGNHENHAPSERIECGGSPLGRFPANVIHDGSDEVLDAFEAFGSSKSSDRPRKNTADAHNKTSSMGKSGRDWITSGHSDEGTAARFFYSAKASKADRANSKHPTVKPLALMRYLCKLVCPPGGVILDPFAGSGTTLQAAMEEGFSAIGIEQSAEYVSDIKRRLELARKAMEKPAPVPKPKKIRVAKPRHAPDPTWPNLFDLMNCEAA